MNGYWVELVWSLGRVTSGKSSQGQVLEETNPSQFWRRCRHVRRAQGRGDSYLGPATQDTQNLRFRLIPTCKSPRYGGPQEKSGKSDLLASPGQRNRLPLAPPLRLLPPAHVEPGSSLPVLNLQPEPRTGNG